MLFLDCKSVWISAIKRLFAKLNFSLELAVLLYNLKKLIWLRVAVIVLSAVGKLLTLWTEIPLSNKKTTGDSDFSEGDCSDSAAVAGASKNKLAQARNKRDFFNFMGKVSTQINKL